MSGSSSVRYPKPMLVEPAPVPLRIAVVYGRIPVPMRRADQMTVAHLLAFLSARGHTVDLYTVDSGAVVEDADYKWLQSVCRSVKTYPHKLGDITRGLLGVPLHGLPVQVGLFTHSAQKRDVHAAVADGAYDLIYTYYFRSAEITKGLGRSFDLSRTDHRPVSFLALQLSQSLNTQRIAEHARDIFTRAFYSVETKLVGRYESRIWRDFTRSVLISPHDFRAIESVCQKYKQPTIANHVFCAHGTDLSRFAPRQDIPVKPKHLVFSGVMRTTTNVQAVQWFAENVFPSIRRAHPDCTWAIVGREPGTSVRKLASIPGVTVTGSVPDPSVYIAEAAICVNPMQAGGGMQNKLIEYLACGKPVVATSVANEGIGAKPGQHLLQADRPEDFASAVLQLMEDQELAARLSDAGRQFVMATWSWEGQYLELEKHFYDAISASQRANGIANHNEQLLQDLERTGSVNQ